MEKRQKLTYLNYTEKPVIVQILKIKSRYSH